MGPILHFSRPTYSRGLDFTRAGKDPTLLTLDVRGLNGNYTELEKDQQYEPCLSRGLIGTVSWVGTGPTTPFELLWALTKWLIRLAQPSPSHPHISVNNFEILHSKKCINKENTAMSVVFGLFQLPICGQQYKIYQNPSHVLTLGLSKFCPKSIIQLFLRPPNSHLV